MSKLTTRLAPLAASVLLAACASQPAKDPARTATIQRTAYGVAHVSAPNAETLAYGVAYAHAQDNVCQTADHLVTIRAQRSRYFGGQETSMLGRRMLPNEVDDFFITAHMDDALLEHQWAAASAEAQALARGYVEGYNRFLADKAGKLPAACNGQPWVQPMTLVEYRRLQEELAVQAASAALADGILGAAPPAATTGALSAPVNLADAADAIREVGMLDSPLGSNAWAFGKDSTANSTGLLLGNPHFPWTGINRFWQVHLTIPGQLDVMGVRLGHGAVVQIGFNKDVAWSHTVSTGKRFTFYELTLAPNDPTTYLVDGQPEKMKSRVLRISVRQPDGSLREQTRTVWSTRWGPLIVVPRAGLTWTARTAYALKDANAGNMRFDDTWLGFAHATSVNDMRKALSNEGVPWVNTLAVDRLGQAMYADASVVPDVDAAQLERCAPSPQAAALRGAAGLVVLNGSLSNCDWHHDPASPVPGLTPIERMPIAIRTDWVQNSNDSFFYSNPLQRFEGISPMVGDTSITRPRTRAGLTEIPQLLARGKATPQALQQELFENRNFMASVVLPDLLAACPEAPTPEARDGCAALAGWGRRNDLEARGAHLFREFWRPAMNIPRLWRIPFDPQQPVATPYGLNMANPEVAAAVWAALKLAVTNVRGAGFALDATLGSVQRPAITKEPIPLHGGDEIEGVLNNLGRQVPAGITKDGLLIDYGTSYVQTVTFDASGPVAQGILTYGQSTDPASPHATDQLRVFSRKEWPVLPFRAEDVARARVGDVLQLTRPQELTMSVPP
jgi:acyl-homoserine-lactone acylase